MDLVQTIGRMYDITFVKEKSGQTHSRTFFYNI
jgi:hypothetical protein